MATVTTVSASANDGYETWESRTNGTEHRAIDSWEGFGGLSYEISEDGVITPKYDFGVFGTRPPSLVSPTVYLYGPGSVSNNNWYINEETWFNFTVTGNSAQYSDFVIGATNTVQNVYIQPRGSSTVALKITMEPLSSNAQTVGSKTVTMKSSNYNTISFNRFTSGGFYAVKVELADSADKTQSYTGNIYINGTGF